MVWRNGEIFVSTLLLESGFLRSAAKLHCVRLLCNDAPSNAARGNYLSC